MNTSHRQLASLRWWTQHREHFGLTAKGNKIRYQEFNGGHSYLNWRGSFADGLVFLAQ